MAQAQQGASGGDARGAVLAVPGLHVIAQVCATSVLSLSPDSGAHAATIGYYAKQGSAVNNYRLLIAYRHSTAQMCMGAIQHARIKVIFLQPDEKRSRNQEVLSRRSF